MRTTLVAALAALWLAGCGGPVVGSLPDDGRDAGAYRLPSYGLPVAYFAATIKRGDDCLVNIELKNPVFVRDPDPAHNYTIRYHHRFYTEDTLTVQTDDAGLLSAINTTSENKSAAIVDKAMSLALGSMGVNHAEIMHDDEDKNAGKPDCNAFTLDYLFNPLSEDGPHGRNALNAILKPLHAVVAAPVPLDGGPAGNPANNFCTASDGKTNQCVYFRVMRAYSLTACNETYLKEQGVAAFFRAPDPSRTYAIPLRRGDFTKFDMQLEFEHGVLTKLTSKDDSELLGLLGLPSQAVLSVLGLHQ